MVFGVLNTFLNGLFGPLIVGLRTSSKHTHWSNTTRALASKFDKSDSVPHQSQSVHLKFQRNGNANAQPPYIVF